MNEGGCIMVDVVIEVPLNSKLSYDVVNNVPYVREVRYFPLPYPIERGYISNTISDDGSRLRAFLLNSEETIAGGVVPARVIGYLEMTVDGIPENMIFTVSDINPKYSGIENLSDVSHFTLKEVTDYYLNYGRIHNKNVEIFRYHSKDEALQLIKDWEDNMDSVENIDNV